MTTMKLKILHNVSSSPLSRVNYKAHQFAEVESAEEGARILRGTISLGYSQVIPSQPIYTCQSLVPSFITVRWTHSEERVEDKQKHSRYNTGSRTTNRSSGSQDDHGKRHANRTEKHQWSATNFFDQKYWDPRRQEVLCPIASGQDS